MNRKPYRTRIHRNVSWLGYSLWRAAVDDRSSFPSTLGLGCHQRCRQRTTRRIVVAGSVPVVCTNEVNNLIFKFEMNAQAVTSIFFVGSNVLGLLLSFTIAFVIVWGVSAHSPGAAHQCSGKRKSEMEDIVLNHICSCSIV